MNAALYIIQNSFVRLGEAAADASTEEGKRAKQKSLQLDQGLDTS